MSEHIGEAPTHQTEAVPAHEQQPVAAASPREGTPLEPQQAASDGRPAPSEPAFGGADAPAPAAGHVSPGLASTGDHSGGAAPMADTHLAGLGNTTHLDGTRLASGPSPTRPASADRAPGSPDDAAVTPPGTDAPANGGAVPPQMGAMPHMPGGSAPHSAPTPHSSSTPRPTTPTDRPAGQRPDSAKPFTPGPIKSRPGGTPRTRPEPGPRIPGGRTEHAPTVYSPEHPSTERTPEQLVHDLPGMSAKDRQNTLLSLTPEGRRQLAGDHAFVDKLKDTLPPKEFARTAAHLLVEVDPRAELPVTSRGTAHDEIERMLQDPDTAAALLKAGASVHVIPRDVEMTDVGPLKEYKGDHFGGASGEGRGLDDARGSGGLHTAITEENLRGVTTTIGADEHYHDGYSTTTHEFAHTIHLNALSPEHRQTITDLFNKKLADPAAHWPDGPRKGSADGGTPVDNYSSRDELEYFAQATNTYLGTNHGIDPYTGHPRNNGADWVRAHDPELLPVLEKLYGKDPAALHPEQSNPVDRVKEEDSVYAAFRDLMGGDTHEPHSEEPHPDAQPEQPHPETPHPETPPHDDRSDLPSPPPKAAPSAPKTPAEARANGEFVHNVAAKHAFDAIDGFLGGKSGEFAAQLPELEKYNRADLIDRDTYAMLDEHRAHKVQTLELLQREAPKLHVDAAKAASDLHDALLSKADLESRVGADPGLAESLRVKTEEVAVLQEKSDRLSTLRDTADAIPPNFRGKKETTGTNDPVNVLYKKLFADSPGGRLRSDPHTELVEDTRGGKKPAKLDQPKVNRNHIVADTMLHKYMTAAVFKARTLDDVGRLGASQAFGEFSKTITPDSHRVLDAPGRAAEERLNSGHGLDLLTKSDLEQLKKGEPDLGTLYGAPDLPVKLENAKSVSDAASAQKSLTELRDGLGPIGHDGPVKEHLDRLGAAIDGLKPGADLTGVHKGFDDLRQAVHAKALDDLAVTNGVTGRHQVDELTSVLPNVHQNHLSDPQTREVLAKRLDSLSDTYKRVGHDPVMAASLADHAKQLRGGPVPGPETFRKLADTLAPQRDGLHQAELKQATDLNDTAKPPKKVALADLQKAVADAPGKVAKADADWTKAQTAAKTAHAALDTARAKELQAKADARAAADAAAKAPTDAAKATAKDDAAAEAKTATEDAKKRKTTADKADKALENTRSKPGDARAEEAASTATLDRVNQELAKLPTHPAPTEKARQEAIDRGRALADHDLVGAQYGGAFARSRPGAKHPATLFEEALKAPAAEVPARIAEITTMLSNSTSNLRMGDKESNQWIQNFLDPHMTHDEELLTAVAHEQLPPEVLYTPHTREVLRGLSVLEDAKLVPKELGEMMAPQTHQDLHIDPSTADRSKDVRKQHGVPDPTDTTTPVYGKIPVSSSGEIKNRPDPNPLPQDRVDALNPDGPPHVDPPSSMEVDSAPHESDDESMEVDPAPPTGGPGALKRNLSDVSMASDDDLSLPDFKKLNVTASPPPPPPASTPRRDVPPPPRASSARRDVPPPPPKAKPTGSKGSKPVASVAKGKSLDAVKDHLGDNDEFRTQLSKLKDYGRDSLSDDDSYALLAQHEQRKGLLLDVLSRAKDLPEGELKRKAEAIPADWRSRVHEVYEEHFADLESGPLRTDPHAEAVRQAWLESPDGKLRVSAADVNRNHIIADTMLHKYVVSAVFKARSLDDAGRKEALGSFSEFTSVVAPDAHRVLVSDKKNPEYDGQGAARLFRTEESSALLRRDLDQLRNGEPDFGTLYGDHELGPSLEAAHEVTDAASARASLETLREQLDPQKFGDRVGEHLDQVGQAVDKFSSGGADLNTVKEEFAKLHEAVKEKGLADLALVNGLTGGRSIDDAVATLTRGQEGGLDLSHPDDRKALADQLANLSDTFRQAGHPDTGLSKQLADQAQALRDPNGPRPAPGDFKAISDRLGAERGRLHDAEIATADRTAQEHLEAARKSFDDAQKANPVDGAVAPTEQELADRATEHLETISGQYGGAYAHAGPGELHPDALFAEALDKKTKASQLPDLISEITERLSNSTSNLRFGNDEANQWISNLLDPHITRDPDLLTAVAHGQLPPEVLNTPHTAAVIDSLGILERAGLAPVSLREMMRPKTQQDLHDVTSTRDRVAYLRELFDVPLPDHAKDTTPPPSTDSSAMSLDPSPSAQHPAEPPLHGRIPVSSSGNLDAKASDTPLHQDVVDRLNPNGPPRTDTATPMEVDSTQPGGAPGPLKRTLSDVSMTSVDEEAVQDSKRPQVARPSSTPPPPPPASTPRRDVPPPPPKARPTGSEPVDSVDKGRSLDEEIHLDATHPGGDDLSSPPPPSRPGEIRPEENRPRPEDQPAPPPPSQELRFGPVRPESTEHGTPRPAPEQRNLKRKAGDDEPTEQKTSRLEEGGRGRNAHGESEAKFSRIRAYEDTLAVREARGLKPPTDKQKQEIEQLTGRQPYPELTEKLLKAVNPHEGAADGSSLHSCLEAAEALRDTHYGKPRPSDIPLTGRPEADAAWTLLKRSESPRSFGDGKQGIEAVIKQVHEGGPGTFSTVLLGKQGQEGHALALIHGQDGVLRWADPSTGSIKTVHEQPIPPRFGNSDHVWAATTDPQGHGVPGGVHDPAMFGKDAPEFGAPLSASTRVRVQDGLVGPVNADQVRLEAVRVADDRPMTRFEPKQKSHTVPWALQRRAIAGMAGRTVREVLNDLEPEIAHLQNFPPQQQASNPRVMARWNELVARLQPLADPGHLSPQEWQHLVAERVSGYVELSQLTSFATYNVGSADGHGEAAMLKNLSDYQSAIIAAPHLPDHPGRPAMKEVLDKMFDARAGASLSPEGVRQSADHLVRSMRRAYPEYMQRHEPEFVQQLSARIGHQVDVAPTTVAPLALRQELTALYGGHDGYVAHVTLGGNGDTLGPMALADDRPPTQFAPNQESHTASWSMFKQALQSFEGQPRAELSGWLTDQINRMGGTLPDGHPQAGQLLDLRAQIQQLPQAPHDWAGAMGGAVEKFVAIHQLMPQTSFADPIQGKATAGGELPFVDGPNPPRVLASHFDGAAAFKMSPAELGMAYQGWQHLAGRLGTVDAEAVNLVAAQTFNNKNFGVVRTTGRANPLPWQASVLYLEGPLRWEGGLNTAFGADGQAAVAQVWAGPGGVRDEYTVGHFGTEKAAPDMAGELHQLLGQVQASDRPQDAAHALERLAFYYQGAANVSRGQVITLDEVRNSWAAGHPDQPW
ncbi:toxin glutamine deamidase domain-containing protein [Kitasatospora sp. MAP5-34]|uniref:toxin glutamine deamidase domain-containing protein n=1 Tax=Kitasatospora sp. MAP5-34 TaxID=3035102 RepID=UPI002473C176|nr:toxin glutamine deamidase domain-containing protein [Kitasatospora sp. MAP5-34]